jgi:hypothetical protein
VNFGLIVVHKSQSRYLGIGVQKAITNFSLKSRPRMSFVRKLRPEVIGKINTLMHSSLELAPTPELWRSGWNLGGLPEQRSLQTWDRFYKIPFRPKTFRINFHPHILGFIRTFLPKRFHKRLLRVKQGSMLTILSIFGKNSRKSVVDLTIVLYKLTCFCKTGQYVRLNIFKL